MKLKRTGVAAAAALTFVLLGAMACPMLGPPPDMTREYTEGGVRFREYDNGATQRWDEENFMWRLVRRDDDGNWVWRYQDIKSDVGGGWD